jgi:hypothetical protein
MGTLQAKILFFQGGLSMKSFHHSLLLLAAFSASMFANSVLSQTLSSCPNVTIGATTSGAAIYSDCSLSVGSTAGYHPTMAFFDGTRINQNAYPANNFTPAPAGDVPIGQFDGQDRVAEDMGVGYTGNCTDMTSPYPTTPSSALQAVDGHVYCYRITNSAGNSLWIRGTADIAGSTWLSPLVITNQAVVVTPSPTAGTPVPTLPLFGLGILVSVLGLFGLSKLRQ